MQNLHLQDLDMPNLDRLQDLEVRLTKQAQEVPDTHHMPKLASSTTYILSRS